MEISGKDHPIQNPDISVIIPTYNRISLLKEALGSVFLQEFDGVIEIFVVDDNSQDGTSEVISQIYPEVYLTSLKENVGCPAARNRALLEAKGRFIAFLDSDDLWEKNYFRTQLAALQGQEKGFCVSDLVVWHPEKNIKRIQIQRPNYKKYTSPIHHLLVGTFIYTPSSVIFPRQVFDDVGLFEETPRVGADVDLYIRCLLAGYQPIFTELPTTIKREHNQGQLTDMSNMEIRKKGRLARAKRFYPFIEKKFSILSLEQLYAEIHANYASHYFRKRYFFQWFFYSLAAAQNASPKYAMSNMMYDIRCLFRIGTRLKNIRTYLTKRWN